MRGKQGLSKMGKNYFKSPNKIFGMNLSQGAIGLYCLMASLPENFEPSIRFLSKAMKSSPTSVRRFIVELTDRNMIRCYVKGRLGKASRYEFLAPKDWKRYDSPGI